MRKIAGLVGFSLLILAGCKTSTPPASNNSSPQVAVQSAQTAPATPPQPKYGWKTFHEETFEIQNTQGKSFKIPVESSRLKVSVDASSAVFAGAMSLAVLKDRNRRLFASNFNKMPCSLMYVDKSETTCVIDRHERMVYFVRDKRAEGSALSGVLGTYLRSPKSVDRAFAPNKVEISLATWACIENCVKN